MLIKHQKQDLNLKSKEFQHSLCIKMEKNSKEEQIINHMDVIHRMKYLFQGELAVAERYRECLLEDIKRYDQELYVVTRMQEPNDIVM